MPELAASDLHISWCVYALEVLQLNEAQSLDGISSSAIRHVFLFLFHFFLLLLSSRTGSCFFSCPPHHSFFPHTHSLLLLENRPITKRKRKGAYECYSVTFLKVPVAGRVIRGEHLRNSRAFVLIPLPSQGAAPARPSEVFVGPHRKKEDLIATKSSSQRKRMRAGGRDVGFGELS